MKKIILLSATVFLFAFVSFCQVEQKNGTIYIKHPYIDIVNKATKAYEKQDQAAQKYYADTAKFWSIGMEKQIPMSEAFQTFARHFENYDSIKMTQVGYPDYLHYIDKDSKIVQSWWRWSGKSKKTGEVLKLDLVKFDEFNKAGKIANEGLYGDFSKMEK